MGSGFSRLSMVDSYVSRRFPMFHLKNRRTFTLFTSWGEMREAVTRGNVTFPAVFSLAYDPFSGNLEHKVGSTGSQKRGEIIVFPLLWLALVLQRDFLW